MTKEREADMVAAHRTGRMYAQSLIQASGSYNDAELQEIFLTAIVCELRRGGVSLLDDIDTKIDRLKLACETLKNI